MISSLVLRLLARRDWRERYPTGHAAIGETLALALSLAVYWYTAKAFGPAVAPRLEGLAPDYFSFILLGEVVLFVPLSLLAGFAAQARAARADGTLDALMSLPGGGVRELTLLGASSMPRDLARAAVTLGAAAAFGFALAPASWLALAAVQCLALPAFLGLGAAGAAAVIRWGRGEAALGALGSVAAVVAGAYFPTSVLPEALREPALYLSPFSALLEASRRISVGAPDGIGGPLAALAVWSIAAVPLAAWALRGALAAARRRGSLEIHRA